MKYIFIYAILSVSLMGFGNISSNSLKINDQIHKSENVLVDDELDFNTEVRQFSCELTTQTYTGVLLDDGEFTVQQGTRLSNGATYCNNDCSKTPCCYIRDTDPVIDP